MCISKCLKIILNSSFLAWNLRPDSIWIMEFDLHGWAAQLRHSFCMQTARYPQEQFLKVPLSKGSGCHLHKLLRPMAVACQPRGPACSTACLWEEELCWGDRVHVLCCEVPEGHHGLMLWLQENRNQESKRHNRNKPLGRRKKCNPESLFPYWKSSYKGSSWAADCGLCFGGCYLLGPWLCWVHRRLSEGNNGQQQVLGERYKNRARK